MKKIQLFISLITLLLMVLIHSAGVVDINTFAQNSTGASVTGQGEVASARATIVIGNKDTRRYHLPGMPYYNKVSKHHRIYFNSEEQAIASGYHKAGTGQNLASRERQPESSPETGVSKETAIHETAQPPSPAAGSAVIVFNYKILIALIVFILLFALPFVPAIVEIKRKQDADPLFIAMNNNKDPRYFGKSFKDIIQKAIAGLTAGPQISEIMLHKKENVQMTDSIQIPTAARFENLLCVQGDMVSAADVHFNKEVYVSGNSDSGSDNFLHVLAADGNITIAEGTKFERWVDAQGNMDIGSNCRLGISASCGGKLHLAQTCFFRRLYGMPISTGFSLDSARIDAPASWSSQTFSKPGTSFIRKTDHSVAEGSMLDGHVIFLNNVRIGHHTVVNGSLKCYGDIELEENVTVYGNIFADGNITLGKYTNISGHVFSQNNVRISEYCTISRPGVVKSVIGKKTIHLEPHVTIYGYVSTEGEGSVS